MELFYTKEQLAYQTEFSGFFQKEIADAASSIDKEEEIPVEIINKIAEAGYLGSYISKEHGGLGLDPVSFGILNEEANKVCTSVRSLITVQSMVGRVIERWGSQTQKEEYLSGLASGNLISSFALTEPLYGSDAGAIELEIKEDGNDLVLNGTKKWISFAQISDVILVFGKLKGKICAIILPADTAGIKRKSIKGLIGAKGCMLAELLFENCSVDKGALIGNIGSGLFPIAFAGLDVGRYSIAWGCVGLAQACLNSTKAYTSTRKQFGEKIKEKQLVKKIITEMAVELKASRLLCFNAGKALEAGSRKAFGEILVAKYYASKMAMNVSGKAVHLHGANGLIHGEYPVERFYRDSKIMQLIEGSDQMLELMIARYI